MLRSLLSCCASGDGAWCHSCSVHAEPFCRLEAELCKALLLQLASAPPLQSSALAMHLRSAPAKQHPSCKAALLLQSSTAPAHCHIMHVQMCSRAEGFTVLATHAQCGIPAHRAHPQTMPSPCRVMPLL
eukprot:876575-Pelagomonas_calceolata.AAC.2